MGADRKTGDARWVLAFDSSCGSCREISMKVSQASAGRLEVRPLDHAQVRGWREESFGPEPPHAPTLIRVREDGVRAWTGASMAPVLVRRLGARATVRVLGALGTLREQPSGTTGASGRPMGRGQFLRLGAGAVVGAGIVLGGATPAVAGDRSRARAWVAAQSTLPQRYEEVTRLPMSYRREVFRASPPGVRSRLFVQQLTRHRTDHAADLTAEQRAVLDRGVTLFSHERMFASPAVRDSKQAALDALRKDGVAAFGAGEAAALLAALTPPAALGHATASPATDTAGEQPSTADDWDDCSCAYASDYCTDPRHCDQGDFCDHSDGGCGTAWLYDCDGWCL